MIVCQLHDGAQQMFYLELILKVFLYKFPFLKPRNDFTKENKSYFIQSNMHNARVNVYRALVGFRCK